MASSPIWQEIKGKKDFLLEYLGWCCPRSLCLYLWPHWISWNLLHRNICIVAYGHNSKNVTCKLQWLITCYIHCLLWESSIECGVLIWIFSIAIQNFFAIFVCPGYMLLMVSKLSEHSHSPCFVCFLRIQCTKSTPHCAGTLVSTSLLIYTWIFFGKWPLLVPKAFQKNPLPPYMQCCRLDQYHEYNPNRYLVLWTIVATPILSFTGILGSGKEGWR